jgi:hypothetical protein
MILPGTARDGPPTEFPGLPSSRLTLSERDALGGAAGDPMRQRTRRISAGSSRKHQRNREYSAVTDAGLSNYGDSGTVQVPD